MQSSNTPTTNRRNAAAAGVNKQESDNGGGGAPSFSSSGSDRASLFAPPPNTATRTKVIPFGTYEKRRNVKRHLITLFIIAFLIFSVGYYYLFVRLPRLSEAQKTDHRANTQCGNDGNSFGTIVGYLDGVAAYSNCNEDIISSEFVHFRPDGEHCASIDDDGTVRYTAVGEQQLKRWELYQSRRNAAVLAAAEKNSNSDNGGAAAVGEADAGAAAVVDSSPSSPPPIHNVTSSSFACGVQTGMAWQCVEFARRYWFLKYKAVFGSIEGAEDIFKLTTADVLAEGSSAVGGSFSNAHDIGNGKHIVVGHRHMEAYRNHHTVVPPQKGDALIWRRQQDMPYGHVGIVAGVETLGGGGRGGGGHIATSDNLGIAESLTNYLVAERKKKNAHLNNANSGNGDGDAFHSSFFFDDDARKALLMQQINKDVENGIVRGARLAAAHAYRLGLEAAAQNKKLMAAKRSKLMKKRRAAGGEGGANGEAEADDDEDGLIRFVNNAPLRTSPELSAEEEKKALFDAQTVIKTHTPIAFIGIADQNYHSKHWGGRPFHRYHILLKDDTHVDEGNRVAINSNGEAVGGGGVGVGGMHIGGGVGNKYFVVDPDGYDVLGWVRLGDEIEEERRH